MYGNIGCTHATTLDPPPPKKKKKKNKDKNKAKQKKNLHGIVIIVSKLPTQDFVKHWTLPFCHINSCLLISASLYMILRLFLYFVYLTFLKNASVTVTAGRHNILKDNFVSRVMEHLITYVNFEFPCWHDIVKSSFASITKNCTSIVKSTMIVSISVIYMLLPRRTLSLSMLINVAPSRAPLFAPILAPCWQATPFHHRLW